MADGALFERRGIPAAVVITHPFTRPSQVMARVYGYPEYRYATILHPISSLNTEQITQRAAAVLPEVLAILGIEQGAAGATADS